MMRFRVVSFFSTAVKRERNESRLRFLLLAIVCSGSSVAPPHFFHRVPALGLEKWMPQSGRKGPPKTDPEGHDRDRYYARVDDYPEVYLIDSGVADVVKDLMREHRRKATGDADEATRHDHIAEEIHP